MKCMNCGSKRLVCETSIDAYVCLDCNYQYPKQYFFVSHSHKDIEKVRIIRNTIEETFFYEPILFFLKSLSEKNEIEDLIKREIEERIWFVYCESENAKKSQYVKFEREYVQNLINNGKKIHLVHINLDDYEIWDDNCLGYLRSQIDYHIKKSKIFLSYSNRDKEIAKTIYLVLKQSGYSVWDAEDMNPTDLWRTTIKNQIKASSYKDGISMFILKSKVNECNYMRAEIEEAIKNNAFIFPIYIGKDESIYQDWINYFNNFKTRVYQIDIDDLTNEIEKMKKIIEKL